MTARRRSLLQNQILLSLRERSAKSITELADRLGAKRPSVSRSLNRLTQAELVIHQDASTWTLTDAGRAEAMLAEERLTDEMVRSIEAASRRYVTIKGKDGTIQRFVDRHGGDPKILGESTSRELGTPDPAIVALTGPADAEATGVSVATLQASYAHLSPEVLDAVSNPTLLDQRILNPLTGTVEGYYDRLQGLASVGLLHDSMLEAVGGIGSLAIEDHFDRIRGTAMATMVGSIQSTVGRISDYPDPLGIISSLAIEDMSRLGIAPALGLADRFSDMLAVGSGVESALTSGLSGLIDRSLAFDVSSVLGPIAAMQDLYADAVATKATLWDGVAEMAEEMRLAAYPSAMLGRIADDIVGIQRAELDAIGRNQTALVSLDWITDRLEETSLAFQGSFTDRLKAFEDFNLVAYGPERYRELMATVTPVAFLTSGIRHYVEAEVNEHWVPHSPARVEIELGHTDLDPILARIHPDLPRMRQSAWRTLGRAEVDDRLSQASLSMRRVIKLILDQLAPVPSGEKMTFRERFYLLMPGSKADAEVAASLFDTFNKFGDRIEMVIHYDELYRHERSLRELMHSAEHTLAFVLIVGGVADQLEA